MTPEHLAPAPTLVSVAESTAAAVPIGVALYDYQTGAAWSFHGSRWFHAASTIKLAVLAAVYARLESDGIAPWHRLHVRNSFVSAADRTEYRIAPARDTDGEVFGAVGRTMAIGDLARHMIAASSNLATNVLLEFVTVERARAILDRARVHGVDLVRGVEDDRAFEAGISNRVTADGLLELLRAIHEGRFASAVRTAEMIAIMAAQRFNSGIPAGLPPPVRGAAKVAHKTGEISTVTHDAGLVFLPGRLPYAVTILTEMAERPGRFEPIARLSAEVFDWLGAAGRRPDQGLR